MFEDSTFESNGRIRTRSRFWMLVTLALNGSILLALVLIPLIYPEALPRQVMAFLMTAPPPPTPSPTPVEQRTSPTRPVSEMRGVEVLAPPRIPRNIVIPSVQDPPNNDTLATWEPPGSPSGDTRGIFSPRNGATVVHPVVTGPVRVPSSMVEGMLLRKTVPPYPAIPREAGIQGTVTLQATISKSGTIENLRAVSGPPMLQQAALDAVKTWVYRPYLLDGQPVEVETTVQVIFSLGR
jgi:protein TonB